MIIRIAETTEEIEFKTKCKAIRFTSFIEYAPLNILFRGNAANLYSVYIIDII